MKLNGKWILVAAVAFTVLSSADAGVVDYFFGNDSEEEAIEEPPERDAPEGAGWYMDEEEFQLGKMGFECLQDLAGVENPDGWGKNLIRPISRVMLAAYGEDGIHTLCGSQLLARMRAKRSMATNDNDNSNRRRNLREIVPDTVSNSTLQPRAERRTGSCSSYAAPYAGAKVEAGGSSTYENFAREHLSDYVSEDRTQRASAVKTFSLQDQLTTVRRAQGVLSRCTQIWDTINQFLAAPDVPGINQEAITEAYQAFVCDLPSAYSDIASMRLQRDQELVSFHNELVNRAEVQAMYENTKILMSELCDRDSRVAAVEEEVEGLKEEVTRL